ncbi:response regulator [Acetobacterium wieringae]|uniref:Circadian input-output histidine kinase CikA n=1 Tax=Acetobacterium wieringae TaxID=52694 RepID=A0A1F2PJF7_9FIRM|nr:transporter substrate-binding domain-containing protein [Acetobacterium wieringae]OFV70982.1 signal transduction histidine-protein kinase BarA [Acetobacterium wieringae]
MKLLARVMVILIIILGWPSFCYARDDTISWTPEELAFMEEHPVIRLGVDPKFVPFEFFDKDGTYQGITSDYLEIISEKTGLEMVVTPGLTWTEAYEKALHGEVDMLPAVSKTPAREQYFLFSEPYYYFKRVIVVRDSTQGISSLEDLFGQTVAVQKNSSHHSYLADYPQLNLSLYDSVEAALTAVADGSETAFVGNLATTNYLINSTGLTNLKYVAFEAEKQQGLYFAVRNDWPVLIGIIDKTLATITPEERIAINSKWVGADVEPDYGPVYQVVMMVSGVIILIWLVSIYWILRLRREIDTRKKIQCDLEIARQEAEAANTIKSSFLARMSHEIRTPLNAITGMAYLVKKTQVTLTQKMYLDRITQSANTMLSIINDILDFSKIEAGKIELERVSFNLDQVIQDVINIVSYKIEEQRIGFKLTKDPKIPNCYFGDAKRIEQILLNLINNATKFTNTGEVSLDIRLVARESNYYHLAFTVRDTGIGMTDEQIKNLFEPFAQGDASINRRFGGTGLGLSIVKSLVDMMKGEIEVYSTAGEGSTFIVELSLEKDQQSEQEYQQQVSSLYFNDIKTLVLEKTGSNMNIIDSYLGAFGMHCELTTSSVSAISMLELENGKFTEPFDLLILDYDTPSGGGFKFVEMIQENKKILKKPKVIMLLPMMREDLFDQLDTQGVDIGIGKPIIPSVLYNGILEIFRTKAIVANQEFKQETFNKDILDNNYGILVVEDNKTNQLIAKSLLEPVGFRVWLGNDGQEGVELFKAHRSDIDLILMDLHMPVLNGYEASEQIRTLSADIPIVAMTADVIEGVKEKCESCGIHHYISKPFDPEQFVETISKIISVETATSKESKHPDSDQNKERADGVAVLDRAEGLRYMGNNQALYQEVLAAYFTENQEVVEKLALAIKNRRYQEAAQMVHKVKSSSGSIGARKLFEVAKALQKALESCDEREIASLHPAFSQAMKQLLTMIKSD